MPGYHFERALFVIGDPNAGKSNQLRSILLDPRLGMRGRIPAGDKISEYYPLSPDRCLYLRLTSPHEMKESLNQFLRKTDAKLTGRILHFGRRWNFACALQPQAANRMPDVVATSYAFVRHFEPERTRIVFLNPDRHGACIEEGQYLTWLKHLRRIRSVEICSIDARDRTANGLFLADVFDFA